MLLFGYLLVAKLGSGLDVLRAHVLRLAELSSQRSPPSDLPVNAMPDPQRTAAEIAGMRVNPVAVPSMASIQAVFKEPPTTPPMIGPFGASVAKAPPGWR